MTYSYAHNGEYMLSILSLSVNERNEYERPRLWKIILRRPNMIREKNDFQQYLVKIYCFTILEAKNSLKSGVSIQKQLSYIQRAGSTIQLQLEVESLRSKI